MAKKVAKKALKKVAAKPAAKTAKPAKVVKPIAKSSKPVAAKAKPVTVAKSVPAKLAAVKPALAGTKATEKTAKPAKQSPETVLEKPAGKTKLELVGKSDEPAPAKKEKKEKKEKKVKVDKTGLNNDQVKWHEYFEKHKADKPAAYAISGQFEAKTPLQHKLFGWGFILSNEYDRLEVLFEDGKRMLISNRKL